MQITLLESSDRKTYKTFLMTVYQETSPYIVGTSDEVQQKTEQERIETIEHEHIFIYTQNEQIVGTCTLSPSGEEPFGHLVKLQRLYVLASYRKQGIGSRLIRHIEQRITDHDTYEKCWFFVRDDNIIAKQLYEKLGWRSVGRLEKERKIQDIYYDESIYEKIF